LLERCLITYEWKGKPELSEDYKIVEEKQKSPYVGHSAHQTSLKNSCKGIHQSPHHTSFHRRIHTLHGTGRHSDQVDTDVHRRHLDNRARTHTDRPSTPASSTLCLLSSPSATAASNNSTGTL